ncbi:MAG TPA: four-helix bundle copper-binding protein [Candidatus Limnocylindria bacterium]|nr:four-helix bundle copper-binding protein [Candidatus Limnocylindria bacterium]
MTVSAQMLDTHPQMTGNVDREALLECIDACFDCAQACTACADACLGEERHLTHLVRCIRLNLDCADVCRTTGNLLLRQTEPDWAVIRAQLEACVEACQSCGSECQRHADGMNMEHCRVCAEACHRCADACRQLLRALPA